MTQDERKEKRLEYQRKYYAANGDRIRERQRIYRAKNPGNRRKYLRNYQYANPEKQRERSRKHYMANIEKQRERVRKKIMNEREVRMRVQSAVHDYSGSLSWLGEDGSETPIIRLESYGQRRVITAAEGFIVTLADGSEFQVTITQSKLPEAK